MKRTAALALAFILLCGLRPVWAEEENYRYSGRGEGLYRLGNTGYLVEHWTDFTRKETLNAIRRSLKKMNEQLPADSGVRKYVYFIESSKSVNLDGDMAGENPVYTLIREESRADGAATLALESPRDYMEWFYKTDHHWNYKGSYRGYCDIVRMILGENEEVVRPAETVVFEELPFNGSYNAKLNYSHSDELFTVYRFEGLKEYTCSSNGSPSKTYGQQQAYFSGKYPRLDVYNHYGKFYGGDAGELIVRTNQPDKRNLLIIANSYSNAVVLLLAQHFNTVCSVDPRYYKSGMGQEFRLASYVRAHEIDDVLVMGDIQLFAGFLP